MTAREPDPGARRDLRVELLAARAIIAMHIDDLLGEPSIADER